MMVSSVQTRLLDGFHDRTFGSQSWNRLLAAGQTDTVNLTYEWQRNWWTSFGRGRLLLITAEKHGNPVALAPFFADGGMIFNLCPEDALDFVGAADDPDVLDALLETARDQVDDFAGFRLYFIPDHSNTGNRLQAAAARLGLNCCDEGALPSPYLDVASQPALAQASPRKKSLLRHERGFLREAPLQIQHLRQGEEILPHLDEFFAQHIERRAATSHPSLFQNPVQQEYYRRLTLEISPTGWLRFTRINWNNRPIAFHYGLCYKERYLLGIPSFAVDLADRSPGEVLLRQLLLAALAEGVKRFDFGIGDEPYKYRFATHSLQLRTWGLYPPQTTHSLPPPKGAPAP